MFKHLDGAMRLKAFTTGFINGKKPILVVLCSKNNTIFRFCCRAGYSILTKPGRLDDDSFIDGFDFIICISDTGFITPGYIAKEPAAERILKALGIECVLYRYRDTLIIKLDAGEMQCSGQELPEAFRRLLGLQHLLPHSFETCEEAIVLTRRVKDVLPWNRIDMSENLMKGMGVAENQELYVINRVNGLIDRCTVRYDSTLEDNQVSFTYSVKNKLQLSRDRDNVFLVGIKGVSAPISRIATQKAMQIGANNIYVSSEFYETLNPKCRVFTLINNLTGSSMNIPRESILIDHDMAKSLIKLNYYQRQILELDIPAVPSKLPAFYRKRYAGTLTQENMELLNENYDKEGILRAPDFKSRREVFGVLKKDDSFTVSLYPAFEYEEYAGNSLVEMLLKRFVGFSHTYLKCARPYSCDENNDLVRLPPDIMTLLGIDETDRVVIKYGGNKISARVLPLNNRELIEETNIITKDSDIGYVIGIPARVRGKLDIENLGKLCRVERDMRHLFIKHLNIQFLPIIAVVFTVLQIVSDIWQRIFSITILTIIAIYVSFSEIRNKIK